MTNGLHRFAAAAIALLITGAVTGALAAPAAASSAVPYTDPAVTGFLGLCDSQGHQVTGGSLATEPFVSSAVSSVAAPAGYGGAGRSATLFAYQPMQNVPADSWSGEELTGASRYTNPAHPMTVATGTDPALQNFVSDYTPEWDGLVQLRLYLNAPGHPTDSAGYAALDIRVSGGSWQSVDGGTVSCTAGTAVSGETKLLPTSALRTPAGQVAAYTSTASPATHSSDHAVVWVLIAVGAAAIGCGAAVASRRRARPDPSDPTPTDKNDLQPALHGISEKGR